MSGKKKKLPETAQAYRDLLLQLIGSLTLCDHMGDVSNDVSETLERMGLSIQWDEWPELGRALRKMGVTTLYGTELHSDDDEDAVWIGGQTPPRHS